MAIGCSFCLTLSFRLNIVLNSYDLIKEAFLKRSDEFSDRLLPGAKDFVEYDSGEIFFSWYHICTISEKCVISD